MTTKRIIRLSLLAGTACALLGCGNTSQPVTSFGKPSTTGGNAITRLDFDVDNNQAAAQATDSLAQAAKVKSFVLVAVNGSANPTVDFKFTGINTVADQFFTPYLPAPVAVQSPAVASGGGLAKMDPTNGQYVSYNSDTLYDYTPGATQNTALSKVQPYFQGQFDINSFVYAPPPQILPDPRTGKPLDTFALLATPEDPAIASQKQALLIHLNLTVGVTPLSTAITANTPQAPALYTRQFTASVPGDGVLTAYNGSAGSGQVDWYCFRGNAQGNLVTASGQAINGQGVPLDANGNVIAKAAPARAVAVALIDKNTGLFTAPIVTSAPSGTITTDTYVIKAISRTQPDKFGTAVIAVSQQTTTIGFK